MDSFEWNKIIGAVLGTAIFIFVVRLVAEAVYEPETPAKPGYIVEGVVEASAGGAAAPAEEVMPDWGTVLPAADVAAGKTVSGKCEQCHDITKGGPNKIGPELWNVVGRPRATEAGFSYSSAMNSEHVAWSFTDLFRYLKSPAMVVPGTKMSFAGIRSAQDRINLIAFLRTQADSPVAVPAPAPAKPADAPAKPADAAAGAGAAPADAGNATTGKSNTGVTEKPATPAASSPAAASAGPAPGGKGAVAPADKAAAPAK